MDHKPKEDKKKKGLLYGCLTAIRIIVVLLILMVSCTACFGRFNKFDDFSEIVTEYKNIIEGQTNDISFDELTLNSMHELSLYFLDLGNYFSELSDNENKDSETSIAELTDLQNKISKTIDNIKTIPLSKLQQYLINIAMSQNIVCTQLISYETTGEQSYLDSAVELTTKASQEALEMNEYITNNMN